MMRYNLKKKSETMILAQTGDDEFELIEQNMGQLWDDCINGVYGEIEPMPVDPPEPTEEELAAAALSRDLSRSEFEWLLAYSGLDAIWDALTQAALDAGELETYADLRAQRRKSVYPQNVVLMWVSSFRAQAAVIDPTVDLSDAAIIAAWEYTTQRAT